MILDTMEMLHSLIKRHLDKETSVVYHDMESSPLKTKKQFSVKVTDVNDVEPHFTKETFQFLTYENQKVDFPIGFINATDPDLGDGGQLTYSIINDNNNDNIPFQLTKYGFISTSQSIDREMKDIYKFKVLVKDNGTPSLNDTANIVIEILDKNDNAPYFIFPNNDPYNLDVHYHPHSKKDITILKASDKDTGNNAFLTYGILKSIIIIISCLFSMLAWVAQFDRSCPDSICLFWQDFYSWMSYLVPATLQSVLGVALTR
ncbi:protocadherin beta-2-like [Octopus bimaculoides]|uniref:protocadherin beta-2-like n=1 Tax=Octopus bimaculoides TaxID=37653 RepID=UPI0022E12AE9|nr:protocadherin beta-2-like [Octopus bimaculoides]